MTGSGRATAGHQRGLRETIGGEVEALRTWLLGGFRMSVGPSRSIGDEDWHLRKAGNLVKLLALTPGHRLHREQTRGLLWPELDTRAAPARLSRPPRGAWAACKPHTPTAAPPMSGAMLAYEMPPAAISTNSEAVHSTAPTTATSAPQRTIPASIFSAFLGLLSHSGCDRR